MRSSEVATTMEREERERKKEGKKERLDELLYT
jgi:hypothetical protein